MIHQPPPSPPSLSLGSTVLATPVSRNLIWCLFGFVTMLRILVGFHPHSGQDNYHGSRRAYGGDFEAQRHWMELTYQLPIGDWYYYDLEYWGLDYPPLTAYISYICGMASHFFLGPESVALEISRGIEDPVHKNFMRWTVLILDLLVYGTAVWYCTYRPMANERSLWTILLALSQPAIILIDHGHFQYNTVALGLSLLGFSYMVEPEFQDCVIGSIFFCLALNFKQMTLYYAPAVFCYLLGRCMKDPKWFLSRFATLGITVILVFVILWEPFIKFGPSQLATTRLDRLVHIIRRIFPLERGLFEGKVANLWCALSTKPVKIRDRIDLELQPLVALASTATLILPACFSMLRLGMQVKSNTERHWVQLLWASTSTALSFFLASFQVHEKSILLALAPCSLLLYQDSKFVDWFSIVCVWTLWPLLQVDRLQVAYACMLTIFGSLIWCHRMMQGSGSLSVFSGILGWLAPLSYLGMLALHVAQIVVPVPKSLADLFEVLWSVSGCTMFSFAWFVTCVKLFSTEMA